MTAVRERVVSLLWDPQPRKRIQEAERPKRVAAIKADLKAYAAKCLRQRVPPNAFVCACMMDVAVTGFWVAGCPPANPRKELALAEGVVEAWNMALRSGFVEQYRESVTPERFLLGFLYVMQRGMVDVPADSLLAAFLPRVPDLSAWGYRESDVTNGMGLMRNISHYIRRLNLDPRSFDLAAVMRRACASGATSAHKM